LRDHGSDVESGDADQIFSDEVRIIGIERFVGQDIDNNTVTTKKLLFLAKRVHS